MRIAPRGAFLEVFLVTLSCTWLPPAPPGLRAEEAPRTVRSITFKGRELHPRETLERIAGIKAGDPWNDDQSRALVERLATWPYLESVGLPQVEETPDGRVDISVSVRELPGLGKVTFQGNEVFLRETLETAAGLRPGQPLGARALQDAEEQILSKYEQDGFLLASVEATPRPGPGGRVDVDFLIREGRRLAVERVVIEGAKQIPEGEAGTYLATQPRRLFGVLTEGYYVPSEAEADVSRLRHLYRSRGYLAAEVNFGGIELDRARRWVTARFRVEEGPRFRLDSIVIEGNRFFSRAHFELAGPLAAGGWFAEEDVDRALRQVARWYEDHADMVPTIEPRLEYLPGNLVRVHLQIREERHYVTGEVHVRGNRRTLDRVIRREIALVPGAPFTIDALERTRARLAASPILRSFEIRDRAGAEAGARDLTVDVVEQEQTGRFDLGGGASQGSGEVAYFSIQERNLDLFRLPRSLSDWEGAFRGGGQTLDIEVIPGTRESEYRARFVEPYFFRSDLALSLGLGTSLYDRRTYDESRLRGAVLLQKHLDRERRLSISGGYVADLARISAFEDGVPLDVILARGSTFLGYPRLQVELEPASRDYFSGPRGFEALGRVDLAGEWSGSQVSFFRTTLSADWSLGFFEERPERQHVLHAGVDLGWIDGLGDEVPIFERFFPGGPRQLPGFAYRGVGPRVGRTPLGGEVELRGSVDYSVPLFRPELRVVALFDWADLEPTLGRIDAERFRTAIGGGLQLRLQIGSQRLPANFYWMKALSSEPGDREQLFSFTLGINF